MRRPAQVALAAAMGVAAIGFLVGIDDGVPRRAADAPPPIAAVEPGWSDETPEAPRAMPATPYRDLVEARIGANASFRSRVGDLAVAPPPPESAPGPAAKRAALAEREARRAFNGAPPVIPHAVDVVSSDSCLGCHAPGAVVDGRTADRMSHPYLTACQQCHVAIETPFEPTLTVASRFVGAPAPFEGARAWPGAPPTIPHSTWMRETCASCHGPGGKAGLRTSHPERANCTQCHAPSAALDQLAVGEPAFVGGPVVDGAASTR